MMANRVDFYQSERTAPAVAAGSVCVFVEGRLCPELEVKKIARAGTPEFGWARLALIETQDARLETQDDSVAIGKGIKIVRFYKPAGQQEAVGSYCIFSGQIERIDREIGKSGEVLEFFARDESCLLDKITVYGRYAAGADGSVLFLPGADTVFNEDSKPNAAVEKVMRDGRGVRLFAADESDALPWSYAEAIEYLLSLYLPAGVLQIPPVERLLAITDNQRVYDLDVTGLSLLDAISRCCEKAGMGLKFVPRFVEDGDAGPEQAIVFFKKGAGRPVQVNLQRSGEQFGISRSDVCSLKSSRFSPVTERYIGQGDYKVFEATFELVKGWDSSLEGTDYDLFSPSSNPVFFKVKDVYRKWVLNEASDYTEAPFNQGPAFDFANIFGTVNFVKRRRRFWPAITSSEKGKSLGYFLEVSFDDGENWQQYDGAFDNRTDECAIWLSSNRLDVDTWVAALKGVLRFRITAAVVSDERVSCVVNDGQVASVVPVREHILTMPSRFKYRKVTAESIFAGQESVYSDEADDAAALYEYIRSVAKSAAKVAEDYRIQTPLLVLDYDVGDCVTAGPESRDVFGRDNRVVKVIERAEMDFDNQCTQLRITGYRMVSV
jgi:hypothetical protein